MDKTQAAQTTFVGSSEMAHLMRQVDWSRTAVGSVDTWPQSARAILRTMLTSRYAMWMGWGPELVFLYNDAYARMTLGAKHPWALGRPASQVWTEIWPDIGPRIRHVLATGEATWDEGLLLFLERSGFREETYHTFSYSPLHDDDGAIIGMFCVVTEETDRVIGERRLGLLRDLGARLTASQTIDDVWQAHERCLESDARDVPFSLVYTVEADGDGLRVASATGMAERSDLAPARLAMDDPTWPIRALVTGDVTQQVVPLDEGAGWPAGPWQRSPTHAMVVAIPQPGRDRAAGVLIAGLNPFRLVDGSYESFVGLYGGQLAAGMAKVQAYAAERERAEALAQIDRAKTTFFSNVSHELRTPLTLMLAPVADALASASSTLSHDTLELIYRNGLRLRKLVNALLEFSRLEGGRIQARFEPVDLGVATAELASAFESLIDRAGLRYVVDTETGGPPVYVDRDMWERIVLNLVSNAFKYTSAGEILVSVKQRGAGVALQVRDTGIGIPAHELPRIFDRFHRVEGARGRTQEGTGIGLALVQELVRIHGGTIAVESVEGRGTTFTITMRAGHGHLPADRIVEGRGSAESSGMVDALVTEAERWLPDATETLAFEADPAESREAGGGDSARIVLADDNADMRAYLGRLLGERWQVHAASDGYEALELARRLVPDLVVTDVMMPHLDGFGLLRALRADERTKDIPVVMLSARAGEESRAEGFEAGADDYLVKPFTAREVMAHVEAQLLRARVRAVEIDQRRRLAAIFSHAPVPIAVLRGPAHVVEMVNDPCLDLIGHRDVVGRPVREAMPELERQGMARLLDRVYGSGDRFVGRAHRLWLRRGPAGEVTEGFFDFVFQPTVDPRGHVDGIVIVAFDVTAMAVARTAAEDANRAKDEFLAMLGHELRNPLAPIMTALQLLRLRGVQAGERERTIIERQVRHLVGLVDDLLDVSRITRGKVRLNRVPMEFSAAVARAIEQASPLLEQHQHDLVVDVPPEGLGVLADPDRAAQIVSNLLTNAAKYTAPGGQIHVLATVEAGEVVLRVRDTGIGMEPDMLPRVFDLFTQDRQAIDRAQGGLGLGLSIVRSLTTLHGGRVTARSDGRGKGSEFIVRLPHIQLKAAAAEAGEPSVAPRPPSGFRVLLVDDNEDAVEMLAAALMQEGHDVAVAHDGVAALALAETFSPDVALLDLGLPVMDGFELAHQMRSRESVRSIRLVAITGYGQDGDRRRTQAAGFDAHLVKPVDIQHVTELIMSLVEKS